MSAESSKSNAPLQATLPISFVIIGGGTAGLACALALRRVGHHALVLERRSKMIARGPSSGIRMSPNLSKIIYHWGLKDALLRKGIVTRQMFFMKYETGERLGTQVWDADMLRETRGQFLMISQVDVYDVLYDEAIRLGAKIRYNAEVVDMDESEATVTLRSGERVSGDVLVGADGEFGFTRNAVVGEQGAGTPTGLVVYDTVIPSSSIAADAEKLYKQQANLVVFGGGHGIVSFPVRGGEEIAVQLYGLDDGHDGRPGDEPSVELSSVAIGINDKLRQAVPSARKAVRIRVRRHADLEDWVSDDGPLVLIGDAAHPFPYGGLQGTAMAVEDGAVLAKLFSHLSERRQIESFLNAFQEVRQERVRKVLEGDSSGVWLLVDDSPMAEGRNALFRENTKKGLNVMEGAGDVGSAWEEYYVVFGYDCEDEADDWWMQWGVLRERALGHGDEAGVAMPSLFNFASMSSVVSSTE